MGSGSQLTGEMLKPAAGIDMTHVPYEAGAQALADVVAGRVDVMFDNVSGVQQFIANGSLKALAVTSPKRLAQYPSIPTMAESGMPSFEAVAWGGIIAPAGTPGPVILRMNAAIAEAMKAPEVVRNNATMSLGPLVSSPEAFKAFIGRESAKWSDRVRRSGAKAGN